MKAPSPDMSRGRLREAMGAKGRGRRRAARELAEAAREVLRRDSVVMGGRLVLVNPNLAGLAECLRGFDQATR